MKEERNTHLHPKAQERIDKVFLEIDKKLKAQGIILKWEE